MATGITTNYFLPYPLSTDPVRVSGDIEQLATKIDNDLQEIIEDKSSLMWTGGTFNNGLNAPTYNDATGKMTMSLAQDLRSTASPTFTGLNINGSSIVFEGSSADDFETTFTVTNPTADRTITFQNGSGTVPFASDVHFIGTTSIALNRASAAQSLTGITSIDGSAATLTTGRTIAMTGDVVWTSPSFNGSANVTATSTIQNDVVTYAKIQNISAQYRVLGRITAGSGDTEELTPDNMVTLINQASTAIAATEGGTGQTSYAIGDILYASSASALSKLAGVATGNALISGGVGTAPSWGKINLTTHVSGTLPVTNGGTGVTTSTGTGNVVLSASPTLTGTPISTTAAPDTNTTQIATTAYVIGQAASSSPLMAGTAAAGTSLRYARQDHVHPTDTTRAPLDSPTFTGTVTIPTLSLTTADTATTATHYFVEIASDGIVRPKTLANVRSEIVTSSAVSAVLDADLNAIAALAGTSGFLKKTAADTWTLDTTAYTTNTGTVTSVGISVPIGLSVSNSPITTSGTIAISLSSGYTIPTTAALDAKAPLASPTFTGTLTAATINSTGADITLLSSVTGSPSSNASIIVNRGTSADVAIRWNETTDAWEYTNDGTLYVAIGSGTGGGGSANLQDVLLFAGM